MNFKHEIFFNDFSTTKFQSLHNNKSTARAGKHCNIFSEKTFKLYQKMGIKREVRADPGIDVPKAKKVKKTKTDANTNIKVEKKTENKVKKVGPQQKNQGLIWIT